MKYVWSLYVKSYQKQSLPIVGKDTELLLAVGISMKKFCNVLSTSITPAKELVLCCGCHMTKCGKVQGVPEVQETAQWNVAPVSEATVDLLYMVKTWIGILFYFFAYRLSHWHKQQTREKNNTNQIYEVKTAMTPLIPFMC